MKCPHCDQEHPLNFQFCPVTGQRISSMQACRNKDCRIFGQYILPPEARYCPECGRPLKDVSGGTSTDGNTEESVLEFEVNGVSFNMIRVEHGIFTMGAASMEEDGLIWQNSKPAHTVILTNDYYIAQTQVTEALWRAVMGANTFYMSKNENLPMAYVTWAESQAFLNKLNLMTGKIFRLPTEAEWEFAARGGNKSKHYQYSGSDNINEVAWYEDNSGKKTHSVALMRPNELGLFDMSGNVWELCGDYFGKYGGNPQTNPTGPTNGERHVYRGGGSSNIAKFCSMSYRSYSGEWGNLGMRLCLSD